MQCVCNMIVYVTCVYAIWLCVYVVYNMYVYTILENFFDAIFIEFNGLVDIEELDLT